MGIVEFDTNMLPTPQIPLLTTIHTQLFAIVELIMITMWCAYFEYRLVYILVGYRQRRIPQSILRDVPENTQSKADVERFVRIIMQWTMERATTHWMDIGLLCIAVLFGVQLLVRSVYTTKHITTTQLYMWQSHNDVENFVKHYRTSYVLYVNMTMASAHENVPLTTAILYRLYNEDGTCIYTVYTYTDDSVRTGYSRCIVAEAVLAIVNVLFTAVVVIYHLNIVLKELLRDYGPLKTTRSYIYAMPLRSGQYVQHQSTIPYTVYTDTTQRTQHRYGY